MGSNTWMNNVIEILLGLCILPIVGYFITTSLANADVTNITGMTILLPLVGVALGFGLVYKGVKGFMGK